MDSTKCIIRPSSSCSAEHLPIDELQQQQQQQLGNSFAQLVVNGDSTNSPTSSVTMAAAAALLMPAILVNQIGFSDNNNGCDIQDKVPSGLATQIPTNEKSEKDNLDLCLSLDSDLSSNSEEFIEMNDLSSETLATISVDSSGQEVVETSQDQLNDAELPIAKAQVVDTATAFSQVRITSAPPSPPPASSSPSTESPLPDQSAQSNSAEAVPSSASAKLPSTGVEVVIVNHGERANQATSSGEVATTVSSVISSAASSLNGVSDSSSKSSVVTNPTVASTSSTAASNGGSAIPASGIFASSFVNLFKSFAASSSSSSCSISPPLSLPSASPSLPAQFCSPSSSAPPSLSSPSPSPSSCASESIPIASCIHSEDGSRDSGSSSISSCSAINSRILSDYSLMISTMNRLLSALINRTGVAEQTTLSQLEPTDRESLVPSHCSNNNNDSASECNSSMSVSPFKPPACFSDSRSLCSPIPSILPAPIPYRRYSKELSTTTESTVTTTVPLPIAKQKEVEVATLATTTLDNPESIHLELVNYRLQSVHGKSHITAYYTNGNRIYYLNHETKVSSWLPPIEAWSSQSESIPSQYSLYPSSHHPNYQSKSQSQQQPQLSHSSTSSSPASSISSSSVSPSSATLIADSSISSSANSANDYSLSNTSLPYGWESAIDKDGKSYFINHLNCSTTYQFPHRESDDDSQPPQPRVVTLERDEELGFGFVAGSERPVIVRFVKEGGPSENHLQAGDQILEINGENVVLTGRERVIELIKTCKQSVTLTVCQPYFQNPQSSIRKSALLTAAKKAKLKSNPSRVRFAEGVVVNGSPLFCSSMASLNGNPDQSCIPFIPNVLKVFLENGQTKTFKYDSSTTVQTVLNSLLEKLSIKSGYYYGIICEQIRNMKKSRMTLLDSNEMLANIAARPNAHNLRCLFRIVFVLPDPLELYDRDPASFDYLYQQCCNDLVHERFVPELKYEIALRLSALRIYEYCQRDNTSGGSNPINLSKINLKKLNQECGLHCFVPGSLVNSMKRKELIRVLTHSLKLNAQSLNLHGQKTMSATHAKLHFLKILSDMPCFGAKMFVPLDVFHYRKRKMLPAIVCNKPTQPESEQSMETDSSVSAPSGAVSSSLSPPVSQSNTVPTSTESPESQSSSSLYRMSPSFQSNESLPLIVSPKYGISYTNSINCNSTPLSVLKIEQISMVKVTKNENKNGFDVEVYKSAVKPNYPFNSNESKQPKLRFTLDAASAEEFVLFIKGYHTVLRMSADQRHDDDAPYPAESIQIIWESSSEWWNDGAPRYYGNHSVLPAGWNYPPNSAMVTMTSTGVLSTTSPALYGDNLHLHRQVDLTVAPPHYLANQLATKNQSVANVSCLTEVVKSIDSRDSQLYTMEQLASKNSHPTRPESIDMPSLISMEILESHGKAPNVDQTEVIQRVSEMNRILKDAEKYLAELNSNLIGNEHDMKYDLHKMGSNQPALKIPLDSDSSESLYARSSSMAPLNHYPSSQDSVQASQESSSSFGVQSSDMLPQLLQAETDLLEMVNSLSLLDSTYSGLDESGVPPESEIANNSQHASKSEPLGSSSGNGTGKDDPIPSIKFSNELYLDTDLIDLRAIPPPLTPEKELSQESMNILFLKPELPPTPYKEEVLSFNINKTESDNNLDDNLADNCNRKNSARVVAELDSLCDTLLEMKSNLNEIPDETQDQSSPSVLSDMASDQNTMTANLKLPDRTFPNDNSSDSNGENNQDTITPPPPLSFTVPDPLVDSGEFITNLIIPPPPPESPSMAKEQDCVIQRFWKATDDVKRICTIERSHRAHYQQLQQHQHSQKHSNTTGRSKHNSSDSAHYWQPSLLGMDPVLPHHINRPRSNNHKPTSTPDANTTVNSSDSESDIAGGSFPSRPHYSSLPTLNQSNLVDLYGNYLSKESYMRQLALQLNYQQYHQQQQQHQQQNMQLTQLDQQQRLFPMSYSNDVAKYLIPDYLKPDLLMSLEDCNNNSSETPSNQKVFCGPNVNFPNRFDSMPIEYLQFRKSSLTSHPIVNPPSGNNFLLLPSDSGKMFRSQSLTLLPSTSSSHPLIPDCVSESHYAQRQAHHQAFASAIMESPIMSANSAALGRFPKPPIPPSSPSIKEKRRQQAAIKLPFKDMPDTEPIISHGQSQRLVCPSSGSPLSSSAVIYQLTAAAAAASAGSNSIYFSSSSSPSSSVSSSGLQSSGSIYANQPRRSQQHQSNGPYPEVTITSPNNQTLSQHGSYFYHSENLANYLGLSTGTAPTITTTSSSNASGNHSHHNHHQHHHGLHSAKHPAGTISSSNSDHESDLDHSQPHQLPYIPESKRSCFQTKEMEEIFAQTQYDIDMLLARLEEVHETRLASSHNSSSSSTGNSNNNSHSNIKLNYQLSGACAKDSLIVESRHFVTASKLFVKCATEGSFQLIDYLTECVTLLERMFNVTEVVIFEVYSHALVTCLVDRLKEVAATYAYTVDTVRRLVGYTHSHKPNPYMDLLMNHATSLATSLSTLMRTLRSMS